MRRASLLSFSSSPIDAALFLAIRFYHFFLGPLLWTRKAPADAGAVDSPSHVPDYRVREDGQEVKGESFCAEKLARIAAS